VGIGVVFGALILGVARNPSLQAQLFSYAILGLFTLIVTFVVFVFSINVTVLIPTISYILYLIYYI
jgi:F0F1-type ATP synthase membrane subunit c/vacuolar-type H+-ATPase subunit K